MAEWTKITLPEDGARAFRADLTKADATSDALRVMGGRVTIGIEGPSGSVSATLAPDGAWFPVLFRKPPGLYVVPEAVYAIQVTGVGAVTVFVAGRT